MSTSVISEKAQIGKNVKVGHFCIIEDDVEIGDNTTIGNYCIVKKGAKIGSDCKFTAYCEIRDNVTVGNKTTFGSRCTISANATIGESVTIKYGFVLTDTPVLEKGDEKVVGFIGDGTLIGANVTLMPGFNIGKNATIGACSQVRNNVGDNEVWFGNPAKLFKSK
jgi:UDP-2-acetamido-3-amino-2,3-dideoxy-glucuronate N-acetyltransferase